MNRLKKVDGKDCNVAIQRTLNTSKDIIYASEFDISQKKLANGRGDYAIKEIQEATWIKPFNKKSKAFIVTFNQERSPEYIRKQGESIRTIVHHHKPTPMMCRN